MNIGELFVTLGMKGADKTAKDLEGVQKGMSGVYSTSLEAKVAIVGAAYALEQLFAASGAMGTNLTNFSAALGISAQTLQQYQGAAREVGVTNEAVESSFRGLQSAATKTLLGKGGPEGLARVGALTGGFTTQDLELYQKAPELFLQRLQQYAQKEGNAGLRNEVLKSFGLGEDMIAAVARNAFNAQSLARAPRYGDREIESLNKSNIAWSKLGTHIEMAIGHFNAKHGNELVSGITKITDAVIKLLEAFMKFAEATHLFNFLAKTLDVAAKLTNVAAEDVDVVTGEDVKKTLGSPKKIAQWQDFASAFEKNQDKFIQPSMKGYDTNSNVYNNTVNQTLEMPETKDPLRAAEHGARHINNAMRQLPAQKRP